MSFFFFLKKKKGDQRLPHDSGVALSPESLASIGVLYHRVPSVAEVDELASSRGYRNRDEITVSPAAMGDIYEAKVRSFFDEHLHEDEEIRYVRDGVGYFDVRDKEDRWVRIRLERDDLIILPAGIYHRFTTDEGNVRFFFCFFFPYSYGTLCVCVCVCVCVGGCPCV